MAQRAAVREKKSDMDRSADVTVIHKSVCRGCHGGCGALLHVRNGELIKVEGNPEASLNHGSLCPIGVSARDLVYHPDRLKYPMRRKGPRGSGEWQRVGWDEALDEISTRLLAIRETYGPESIVLGSGTGRHHASWVPRFANALGTPNWCTPALPQCLFPRLNTLKVTYGDILCNDFTGDTPPACVLFWGHNSTVSGPDGETRFAVRDALWQNPRTIVVDPRETSLAQKADIWLPIRPGTDDAMGLAFINVIITEKLYDAPFVQQWTHGFEELSEYVKPFTPEWAEPITWVSAEKIRAAARLFAQTKPAMLEWGCAIEHTPNTIQTCRALALLPALTGNVDVPGGWIIGMHGLGKFPSLGERLSPEMKAKRLGADKYKLLSGGAAFVPTAHAPSVFHAMRYGEPYPIKAFLVFGNNTLASYADISETIKAVSNVGFVTYTDLFMTPSAQAFADIVLPAASWPELNSVSAWPSFAENVVMPQTQAVRTGECKSDEEIFVELARRMKLDACTESVEEVLDSIVAKAGLNMTYRELAERGHYDMPLKYRKYEEKGFNTPTGKVELYSTTLEKLGYAPLPHYQEPPESPLSSPDIAAEYPLVLTTGARVPFYFCSEGRQIERLRKAWREPRAEIHTDTAKQYGIKDGDWMWIETLRGRIRQKARVTDGIQSRTIAIEFGWWFPEDGGTESGIYKSNANMLTNGAPPYDPAMGTYQLRALLCRVSKSENGINPTESHY